MKPLLFTTSWDDGSVLDLRIADMLERYGMIGTFYIPRLFEDRREKVSAYGRRLTDGEIQTLSKSHEVGGHSVSHRRLIGLTPEEARSEIEGSHSFLMDVTGTPPSMFAFVGGAYDDRLVDIVKEAGFLGARTTRKPVIGKPSGFLMDTTVICQPFPFRKKDARYYYWRRLLDPMAAYEPTQFAASWFGLAKRLFGRARRRGNYFHLYGHSWELEKYGMWEELEKFLSFVNEQPDVTYVTNSEALRRA